MTLVLRSNRSRIAAGTVLLAFLVIVGAVYVYNGRAWITITSIPASQPVGFCEDDRQIIETVLIWLIDAPEFKSIGVGNQPFTAIACDETPSPSHRLEDACSNPGHSLVGESALEYRSHFVRRCEGVSFAGRTWDARVLMIKWDQLPKDTYGQFDGVTFAKSNSGVRAWVQVGLPYYFNNGTHAYLQIRYPNGMHGAGGDFFLTKDSGRWVILWHEFSLYC